MDNETSVDAKLVESNWRARGPYWNAEADGLAEMAARLNAPLIDGVGIAPGQRVLDLASGAGEPCLTIARLVGDAGSVIATDLVDEMLAGAKRRAAEAQLTNIAFQRADMQDLPFEDSTFDRVTCRFGLMFVPDPKRALVEIHRVLKSGGRAGFMVWGPRSDTSFFNVISSAAIAVFGDDPRFEFDLPFRFSNPGPLTELLETVGFSDVTEESRRYTPEVKVGIPFWRAQVQMSLGPRLETATGEELDALDQAILDGFERYRQGEVYRLQAHARLILGTKA